LKSFPGFGSFVGRIIAVRPGAADFKDRRVFYEDGDEEDLSVSDIRALEFAVGGGRPKPKQIQRFKDNHERLVKSWERKEKGLAPESAKTKAKSKTKTISKTTLSKTTSSKTTSSKTTSSKKVAKSETPKRNPVQQTTISKITIPPLPRVVTPRVVARPEAPVQGMKSQSRKIPSLSSFRQSPPKGNYRSEISTNGMTKSPTREIHPFPYGLGGARQQKQIANVSKFAEIKHDESGVALVLDAASNLSQELRLQLSAVKPREGQVISQLLDSHEPSTSPAAHEGYLLSVLNDRSSETDRVRFPRPISFSSIDGRNLAALAIEFPSDVMIGSFLDLIAAQQMFGRDAFSEDLIAAIVLSSFGAVGECHQRGVIHGDLSCRNMVLMQGGDTEACCVALAGFGGKGIDLNLFEGETTFMGGSKCGEDGCSPMDRCPFSSSASCGRGWRFEPDLFGLADTIHVLLHGGEPINVSHQGGKYAPSKTTTSGWMRGKQVWDGLIDCLLNPKQNVGVHAAFSSSADGEWPELSHLIKLLADMVSAADIARIKSDLAYLSACVIGGGGRQSLLKSVALLESKIFSSASGEDTYHQAAVQVSQATLVDTQRQNVRAKEREQRERDLLLEQRERKIAGHTGERTAVSFSPSTAADKKLDHVAEILK